jgi:hypothetical protein
MFKLSNKLKLNIPNGWHEIPFKIGIELMENPNYNDVEVMALITGVDADTIRAQTSYTTVSQLLTSFTYLQELPNPKYPELPKVVNVAGETYLIPFVTYNDKVDMGNCSIGAIEDIKAHVKANTDEDSIQLDVIRLYPVITAMYLQSLKGYSRSKALELSKHVDSLDFKTVYNIGNFFLLRQNGLTTGSHLSHLKQNIVVKKLRRVWYNWTQRLVSILPLIP